MGSGPGHAAWHSDYPPRRPRVIDGIPGVHPGYCRRRPNGASMEFGDTSRARDDYHYGPYGRVVAEHAGPVTAVAFPAAAASARRDQTVRLGGVGANRQIRSLVGHTGPVTSVAFGNDHEGRLLLASASEDETVRLWDPLTGRQLGKPFVGHTGPVFSVAFGAGPDHRLLLASGGGDQTVRIWDAATGTQTRKPLIGHTDRVHSLVFGVGPDGHPLMSSAGRDQTVRVWNPITGLTIAVLHRRSSIRSIANAGTMLAIGDGEGVSVIELSG